MLMLNVTIIANAILYHTKVVTVQVLVIFVSAAGTQSRFCESLLSGFYFDS